MSPPRPFSLHQKLLLIGGSVYLAWWFLVKAMLPDSFNPLFGRLCVVALFYLSFVVSLWAPRKFAARALFFSSAVLTLHYFYLMEHNSTDLRWWVGAYITVAGVAMCQVSRASTVAYSVWVLLLGAWITHHHAELRSAIFLPGLLTISVMSSFGIWFWVGAQQRLAESSERFRKLFDAAFEVILVHDGGRILDVNSAVTRVYGYTREEALRKTALDFIHPDFHETLRAKIAAHEEITMELRGVRAGGAGFPIEARTRVSEERGRRLRFVAIRDLTDRKQAEAEHIAARAAQRAIEIRDEFISIASHELKTPLTASKLALQSAQRQLEAPDYHLDPARWRTLFGKLDTQFNRLGRLIDDMLDVSRISLGHASVSLAEVDLAAVVRESVELHEPLVQKAGCKLKLDLPPSAPIWGDRGRLEQVVGILLTNAIKYGAGSPIEVSVDPGHGGRAFLRVRDRGIGIAADKLETIFDRFERAVSPKHQYISGLGLGLYIARQILAAHGGRIYAQSRPGEGSTFTVELRRRGMPAEDRPLPA